MRKTMDLLRAPAPTGRVLHPIAWSTRYLNTFEDLRAGVAAPRAAVDVELAPLLIMCAGGAIEAADTAMTEIALANLQGAALDQEVFISLLFSFYVAQRFDVVETLLEDRYDYGAPFRIGASAAGPGQARVLWTIRADGTHEFTFDAASYAYDKTRDDILAFQWEFPLFSNYAKSANVETGAVVINQADVGISPGLCYCDSRPDYFLIPDCIFVPTRGYAYHRTVYHANAVSWASRKPVAMWRGATTGIPASPHDWRSLERVKLCQKVRGCNHPELFDVGLSTVIQFADPGVVGEIRGSDLMADFIPWEHWINFRYLIDIDGNSSPWSNLFQKLLTGSTVLKVHSSRQLAQWYYDDLVPWHNYVPIAPDLSDLVEKVRWLARHDDVAANIGRAGATLAARLTIDRELRRSVPVISAAFRYFRGDMRDVAPHGWVAPDNAMRRSC